MNRTLQLVLKVPALIFALSIPLPCQESAVESAHELEFLEDAIRSGYHGHYRTAAGDLRDHLYDFPESARALEGLVMVERFRGKYQEALGAANKWVDLCPDDSDALCELAETLCLFGRYEAAEARLREAVDVSLEPLKPRVFLAELLYETGRREEARALAEVSLESRSAGEGAGRGDELCLRSRLFYLLGDLDRAVVEAVYADKEFNGRRGSGYRFERFDSLLILGKIYRETRLGTGTGDKGSGNRALSCFRDALKVNPNLAESLTGIARTRSYAFKFNEAMVSLNKALNLNPVHAGALACLAHSSSVVGRCGKALELVERGLEVNPRDKTLLAEKAAALRLNGDMEGSQAVIEKALNQDPCFGGAYMILGELLIFHYRFSEAEKCLRKCIETDPDCNEAYILLGRALANLGQEKEARKVLLESADRDPFPYPWRDNMLRVLSDLDTFIEEKSDLFRILLDVEEAGVMRSYLLGLGRESIGVFQEKYGFRISGPVLMEMFPEHQDFAVRTVGFTGLGALGACFGRVVTLLSPGASMYRGKFNWATTLHHELCHVFTLQMSRNRIPRWFTEGISVYEEGQRKASCRRNLDMELYNSFHNGKLFKVVDFNSGFMGSRVLFAYYQAGLAVEFIVSRIGIEGLCRMISGFGKGLDTRKVLDIEMSMSLDEFDESFERWLWDNILQPVRCSPVYDSDKHRELLDAATDEDEDIELLLKAARACFQNGKSVDALYFLNKIFAAKQGYGPASLLKGEIALSRGNEKDARMLFRQAVDAGVEDLVAYRSLGLMARNEGNYNLAVDLLIKAKGCFPSYIGGGSPCLALVELYSAMGRAEDAVREMESLIEHGMTDLVLFLKVAEHHIENGSHDKASAYLEEAVHIDPFQRLFHLAFAKELGALSMYVRALEELDIALEAPGGKSDPAFLAFTFLHADWSENAVLADIHAEKGAIFLKLGNMDSAEVEVKKALLLDPDHEQALEMEKKL